MKIGASARIGTICEQMIQGSRLFSSTRLCTIISARHDAEQRAEHKAEQRRRQRHQRNDRRGCAAPIGA